MNDSNFIIQRVSFDFQMESEDYAHALNSRWNSFLSNFFINIVNRVLQEFDSDGEVLQFDKLELNLGVINQENFDHTFALRLSEQLREQLLAAIHHLSENNYRKRNSLQSNLEILFHFLRKGYYPWAQQNKNINFQQLYTSIVEENTASLIIFLRQYCSTEDVRHRLIQEISKTQLFDLISKANSNDKDFIIEYTETLLTSRVKLNIPNLSEEHHYIVVGNIILIYVFAHSESNFNRKMFIAETIKSMAYHYNLSWHMVLESLLLVVKELNYIDQQLYILLQELSSLNTIDNFTQLKKEAVRSNKTTHNTSYIIKQILNNEQPIQTIISKLNEQEFVEVLYAIRAVDCSNTNKLELELSHALTNNLNSTLTEHIAALENMHNNSAKEELIRYFRQLIKKGISHKQLIIALGETKLKTLLVLIEPQDSPFIISYATSLDHQKDKGYLQGKAGGEFQLLKWEFLLAVWSSQNRTNFNKKQYILDVMKMLSHHYNIDLKHILQHLYTTHTKVHLQLPSDISTIITELNQDFTKGVQSSPSPLQIMERIHILSNYITLGEVNKLNTSDICIFYSTIKRHGKAYHSYFIDTLREGFSFYENESTTIQQELYIRIINDIIQQTHITGIPQDEIYLLLQQVITKSDTKMLKTLLLALLKKDTKLYHTITKKQSSTINPYSQCSYQQLLSLCTTLDKWNISLQHAIYKRCQESTTFFNIMMACCSHNARVTQQLSIAKTDNNEIPFIDLLHKHNRLHVSNYKFLAHLLQQLSSHISHAKRLNYLVLFIKRSLNSSSSVLKTFVTDLITQLSATEIAKCISSYNSYAIKHSLSILTPNKNMVNTSVAFDLNCAEIERTEDFIIWLQNIQHHPHSLDQIYNPYIENRFFSLLNNRFVSLKEAIDNKNLDEAILCQWVKKMSLPIKYRWLELNHTVIKHETINKSLELIDWAYAFFKQHQLTFVKEDYINTLIDYTSGTLQYLNNKAFIHQLIKYITSYLPTQKHQLWKQFIADKSKVWEIQWTHLINKINATTGSMQTLTNIQDEEIRSTLKLININNAGLVIFSPFLNHLLNKINIVGHNNKTLPLFKQKAPVILQYLAYRGTNINESQLVLNKILCGIQLDTVIDTSYQMTKNEKAICESLLDHIISLWKALGHTTKTGLCESFIQRKATIEETPSSYKLNIEQKSFDVLIDRIPWSFKTTKLPWMSKPIIVNWR